MKRSLLEQYLAQTDDRIDRATEQLERLSRTAIQLKEAGRDAQIADELLTQFERSLQILRNDRDLILRALTQIGESRLPPGVGEHPGGRVSTASRAPAAASVARQQSEQAREPPSHAARPLRRPPVPGDHPGGRLSLGAPLYRG